MRRVPTSIGKTWSRGSGGCSDRTLTTWTTGLLLASVLPQYLVSSLVVEIRSDFPFSDAQLGLAVAVSFALSAVVSPLTGRSVSRLGIGWGVWASGVLVVISSVAIGAIADSATDVTALMAVIGVAGGIGSPTISGLLAQGVRPERRGTAFGLFTSAPQMAAFGAGLALPLVAHPLSWQATFAMPAAISVVCLGALALGGPLPGRPSASATSIRLPRKKRVRAIHAIALAAALASSTAIGMRTFLVVFAISVGMSSTSAGLLLSATGLLAIASRIGFGVLSDRQPSDALKRAAVLMALSAAGFALMAVGPVSLIVAGALIAGISWGWQSPLSLAVVSAHPEEPAAAIGIQMFGFFVGAIVGPLAVGALAQDGAYTTAWILCAWVSLMAAGAALLARRHITSDSLAAAPGHHSRKGIR